MATRDDLDLQMERLYEQHGKPLEHEHWGEYLAIAPDGRVLLGKDILEVSGRALAEWGPGSLNDRGSYASFLVSIPSFGRSSAGDGRG